MATGNFAICQPILQLHTRALLLMDGRLVSLRRSLRPEYWLEGDAALLGLAASYQATSYPIMCSLAISLQQPAL